MQSIDRFSQHIVAFTLTFHLEMSEQCSLRNPKHSTYNFPCWWQTFFAVKNKAEYFHCAQLHFDSDLIDILIIHPATTLFCISSTTYWERCSVHSVFCSELSLYNTILICFVCAAPTSLLSKLIMNLDAAATRDNSEFGNIHHWCIKAHGIIDIRIYVSFINDQQLWKPLGWIYDIKWNIWGHPTASIESKHSSTVF